MVVVVVVISETKLGFSVGKRLVINTKAYSSLM